jgi:MraZ protein
MLRGWYEHTIDEKGRLSLPARHREKLGDIVILLPGWDKQVIVYPPEAYDRLVTQVASMNQLLPEARELYRSIHKVAECPIDKAGRILIPAWLRAHAGLDTNVIVQGLTDRVEIWNAERWHTSSDQALDQSSDTAARLAELGYRL